MASSLGCFVLIFFYFFYKQNFLSSQTGDNIHCIVNIWENKNGFLLEFILTGVKSLLAGSLFTWEKKKGTQ